MKSLTQQANLSVLNQYSGLLETLYASLWCNDGMEKALSELQKYFYACSATLMGIQVQPRQIRYGWTVGVPEQFGRPYIENNMVDRDPAIDFFQAESIKTQGFVAASQLLGEIALVDIVSDEFKPWLLAESIVDTTGLVINSQENEQLILILQRNKKRGVFSALELEQLNLLAPHLRQTVQLFVKFYRQQSENYSLQAAINTLQQPTIILNSLLQVLYSNTAAQQFLSSSPCISIQNEQLTINDEEIQHLYVFQACKLVSQRVNELDQSFCSTINVPSKSGTTVLSLSPMFDQQGSHKNRGLLIQIFAPAEQENLSIQQIQNSLNISQAEAQVCLLLAKGLSTQEIAKQREVSHNTVREQVRRVYKKTHYSRQSELVTAVLRLI